MDLKINFLKYFTKLKTKNIFVITQQDVVTLNHTKPIPQTFNEVRRSVISSGLQGSSQN